MDGSRPVTTQSGQMNERNAPSEEASPPSYTVNDENAVPNLTAAFSNLSFEASDKPIVDQCIAHLKLLETFHQLREDVAFRDGLFGIQDSFVRSEPQRGELLSKIREKRWAIYVTKAAQRFERWWEAMIEPEAQMSQQRNIATVFKQSVKPLALDHDHLPPLDVIMVWHAYQLNPRNFLEDCLRYGKMRFWRTGLPWAAIDSCINNETFQFTPTAAAIMNFERGTGYPWNSLDETSAARVGCPMCNQVHFVPLTRWDSKSAWETTRYGSNSVLKGELTGNGFADKGFHFRGPCGIVIDHELLKTQKFRRDIEALRFNEIPMPKTLLNHDGIPAPSHDDFKYSQPSFPNRLIRGPGRKPSECYHSLQSITAPHPGPSTRNGSMSNVRSVIEEALADRSYVEKANHIKHGRLAKEEKVSVRRMMSCYWENSSMFSLDLVGAVIRQGTFIDKMHSIDWLHSPTVTSTMKRLLLKYDRYFAILKKYPDKTVVPTLDVDLAWHTHQLAPPTYYEDSISRTGRFINHDDKIAENKLSTAFGWTSKTYQKMFNELYSECTCWYCEAVRESHTSSLKRVLGNNNAIDSQLDHLHATSDPRSTPHISAHNAIRPEGDRDRNLRDGLMRVKLERDYQKAVQRAKKRGREVPRRDETMYAYTYGYPVYMPYYAPYMGDPCTGGLYAANPSCANLTPGAAGNCCQGACGGGVAAGACSGGFSCGGSGGGCGGGGGGCGGGGGGGGGCGGGGG